MTESIPTNEEKDLDTDPSELVVDEKHSTEPNKQPPEFTDESPTTPQIPSAINGIKPVSIYDKTIPPMSPLPRLSSFEIIPDTTKTSPSNTSILDDPEVSKKILREIAFKIGFASIPPTYDEYLSPNSDATREKDEDYIPPVLKI